MAAMEGSTRDAIRIVRVIAALLIIEGSGRWI